MRLEPEIVLDDFSQGIALVPFLGIVDLLAQLKSIKCVVENNKLLHAFHWSLNRLSDWLLRTALGCQVIFHCTGSEQCCTQENQDQCNDSLLHVFSSSNFYFGRKSILALKNLFHPIQYYLHKITEFCKHNQIISTLLPS